MFKVTCRGYYFTVCGTYKKYSTTETHTLPRPTGTGISLLSFFFNIERERCVTRTRINWDLLFGNPASSLTSKDRQTVLQSPVLDLGKNLLNTVDYALAIYAH